MFSGFRGFEGARADFYRRMTAPSELYDDSSSMARKKIRYGTQVTIHPELPGFRFNPPSSNILWLEDWHCIEFRMQALGEANRMLDERIIGRIAFYVGPLLIGETDLYAIVAEHAPDTQDISDAPEMHAALWEETSTSPYRAIFVSYSHEDSIIVDQLERAYRALGDDYLRDVAVLRSGEAWNAALLDKIREASIFQLCWSKAARDSKYVEQEWRYALDLQRPSFIRPMYWQLPMPTPPEELRSFHFSYVPIDDGRVSQSAT